ncbi:MAG: bifunctional DNA primase/polymerase, partial [Bacteriovoracaceae bacterium]
MKIFLCEGKNFLERNLPIVPLNGKRPFVEKWNEFNFNNNESLRKFPHCNIGLKTGKHSGIIALDIDTLDPTLQKKINDLLPPLYAGRLGNPKKLPLRFFQYNNEQSRKYHALGVEILSTGNQCVMPPSMHPETKKPYTYIGHNLLDIDIDDLPLLPDGFISEIEAMNNALRESKKIDGVIADITPSDGTRCNHGSHNKLSQMLVAMILEGNTPQDIVERLVEYDEQINP